VNWKHCGDGTELSYAGSARVNSSVFSLALKVPRVLAMKLVEVIVPGPVPETVAFIACLLVMPQASLHHFISHSLTLYSA